MKNLHRPIVNKEKIPMKNSHDQNLSVGDSRSKDKIVLTDQQKLKIRKILSCEESAHFNPKELHPTGCYSEIFGSESLTKGDELYTKSKEELICEMIADAAEDRYHEYQEQEKKDKKLFMIYALSFCAFLLIVLMVLSVIFSHHK